MTFVAISSHLSAVSILLFALFLVILRSNATKDLELLPLATLRVRMTKG